MVTPATPSRSKRSRWIVARARHARGDRGARLGRAGPDQVARRHRRHLDAEVDAVEQRAGDARLVVGCAARAARAAVARLAGHAAAARVHRRDQLDARRIGDAVVGARDHAFAGLERLAQRIEHLRRELRKLVEEQHAVMGERDLARPHAQAAADHRRHRGRMVRRAERPAVGQLAAGELAGDRGDHRDFEQFARATAAAGSTAAAAPASTCPSRAARPSADCGRRPPRPPAPAWRFPGP